MSIIEILERGMSTYCESGIGLFSTQPINTISNIGLFLAAYFGYQYIKTHYVKNSTIRILPIILVITGVGSILWHGAPNILTGFADTLPLSIFVLVSFFFLLDKILPNKHLTWSVLSVFIFLEVPFIFGVFPSLNGFLPYLIALIVGLFIFFGLAKKYKTLFPQLTGIAALFIVAFFFRTIDHTICSMIPMGTHFIWHIVNALIFYLLIRSFVAIEKHVSSPSRQ